MLDVRYAMYAFISISFNCVCILFWADSKNYTTFGHSFVFWVLIIYSTSVVRRLLLDFVIYVVRIEMAYDTWHNLTFVYSIEFIAMMRFFWKHFWFYKIFRWIPYELISLFLSIFRTIFGHLANTFKLSSFSPVETFKFYRSSFV